jgi:predicted lipoprotein
MTGVVEVSTVLGLISSAITIFEAAQEVYEAASDVSGLPKKFRAAADHIPLVYHTLNRAAEHIQSQQVDVQALKSAEPVLQQCRENADKIKDIFDKTIPGPNASTAERMKKAMSLKMKSNKVKESMEDVIKGLELLAQNQIFQDAETLNDIQESLVELGSLTDEDAQPQYSHSGSGDQNIVSGGTLRKYHNSGSGSQYNAETMTFAGEPAGKKDDPAGQQAQAAP